MESEPPAVKASCCGAFKFLRKSKTKQRELGNEIDPAQSKANDPPGKTSTTLDENNAAAAVAAMPAAPPAPEPVLVNGINAAAIKGMKAKMSQDPTMGKSFPIKIPVELDVATGIVSGPGGLVAAPMPHTGQDGIDPTLATPLSYCPLFATSCYSLVFLIAAAERGMPLDEYVARAETNADFGQFYDLEIAKKGAKPWTKVDCDIAVKGNVDEKALQEVGAFAHARCPASQILQSDELVMVTSVKGKTVTTAQAAEAPTGILNGYDLNKYKAFGAKVAADGKAEWEQKGTCDVYCGQAKCEEFEDALMKVTTADGVSIPTSMDPPIGNGKYMNPVACCFFGACSFYAHTVAVRLSVRGVTIQSLKATFSTVMNKRIMMALDEGQTFDQINIDVEVECSDASPALLEEVRKEADLMCPAVAGMTKRVEFPVRVHQS